MGLFGNNKEETKTCCGGACTPESMARAESAKTAGGAKILGPSCAKCHAFGLVSAKSLFD